MTVLFYISIIFLFFVLVLVRYLNFAGPVGVGDVIQVQRNPSAPKFKSKQNPRKSEDKNNKKSKASISQTVEKEQKVVVDPEVDEMELLTPFENVEMNETSKTQQKKRAKNRARKLESFSDASVKQGPAILEDKFKENESFKIDSAGASDWLVVQSKSHKKNDGDERILLN